MRRNAAPCLIMRYGAAVFRWAVDGGGLAQAGRFSTPWGKSGGKTRLSISPQGRPSIASAPQELPRRVRRPRAAKESGIGFSRGPVPREKHFSDRQCGVCPPGGQTLRAAGCIFPQKGESFGETRSALGALPRKNALHFCESKKKGRTEFRRGLLRIFIRSRRAAERSDGPA